MMNSSKITHQTLPSLTKILILSRAENPRHSRFLLNKINQKIKTTVMWGVLENWPTLVLTISISINKSVV